MDPVLMSVAGLGASVVKFLLHASGRDAVAGLVSDAQEGLGLLARLRGQSNDKDHAVAKWIEKAVAGRVRGMYQKCRDRGVDTERLDGVATEVVRLVDRVAADDSLILEAVRFPDGFAALLRDLGGPIRAELFERSEPYFDELVDAVAGEYVRLAPWSPNFKIEALKYVMGALDRIEEGVDEIRKDVGKGLENDRVTHSKLDELLAGGARSGRLLFGGRPDVASGFVERVEQGRLRGLVVDGAQERTVLVGMAGCGKSQLASALAQWCGAAGWGLVAWLNASSAASVRSDLVELARRLGVDMGDGPTEDQAVRRCLDYLQSAEAGDRLVVFDNVKRVEDVAGVVPRGGGLRVVATSRSGRGWRAQGWERVDVGVFPREESIAYLLGAAGSRDVEAADAVARRLGDLPLALAQAAATASNERWTLKRYLKRLEKYSSKQTIHPVPGDSYTRDVSSALRMAVDSALDRIDGGLREVARLQVGALAVLAESGVPTRWLDPLADEEQTDENTSAEETNKDAGAGPGGEDADAGDAAAEKAHLALMVLLDASVVQKSADGSVTMLHRLQGQVLRENWNDVERAEAFDAAADLLDRVDIGSLPRGDTEGRRRETLDLIDQLRAIAAQDYSRPLFECERVVAGLPHAFFHAGDLGLPKEALALRGAVGVVEEVLGPDHPSTLAFRNNLAHAYYAAGCLGEAIALYEEVVADSVRVLGADHPRTLTSRNNLAAAYQAVRRVGAAIPLFEEVLADRVRVLGDDHPDTLTSHNNLARAYESAGRLGKAISLYEQVLADRVRVLGAEHPGTLTSRNNLTHAYQAAGRLGEAILLYEEVLADTRRVLGDDHPDTLTSCNNLAHAYYAAGRHHEAITLFKNTLEVCEEVLSPDHPLTTRVRKNLEVIERKMNQSSTSSPESSEG